MVCGCVRLFLFGVELAADEQGFLVGGDASRARVPARTSSRMLSHGMILKSTVESGSAVLKTWAKMMSRSSWAMVRRVGGFDLGIEMDS